MIPLPATKVLKPRPFGGPALSLAVELDTHCPGFVSYVLCASSLKRQAIFAALTMAEHEGYDDLAARLSALAPAHWVFSPHPMAQIAQALTVMRARQVVRAVFGEVPQGMLGMLCRLGDHPLPRHRFYGIVFELFSDPRHRERASGLLQVSGRVSPSHLEIARHLDPILMHQNVLNRVSLQQVPDVNAALALVRKTVSTATDAALRQSVEQINPKASLGDFFSRWLRKMDRPLSVPDIPADNPDLAVLSTGEAIAFVGRKFQNCLSSKIPFVASGRHAYLEWRHAPGAVVELHRLSNSQFVLAEVHAILNQRPDPAVVAAIRSKLQLLGVPALETCGNEVRACGVLRLVGAFDIMWDGFDENIDRRLNELEQEFVHVV